MLMQEVACFQSLQSRRFEARRGLGEARRGLGEVTPRTQNVLAQGQSETHRDSKLLGRPIFARLLFLTFFFPSNARWLSPGRLSSRKDNCILQIHRINAVATSVMTTMCIQKRTELDRYIIHWAVTVQNKKANDKNQKQHKTHTNTQKTHQKPARPVISWSVHRHLKRNRRDDNIVAPQGLVWQRRTRANKQHHRNAIQLTCEPGSNKGTMRKRRLPSQEPRDHRVQAGRATFSQILGHYPKASNDTAMWQMESWNRT